MRDRPVLLIIEPDASSLERACRALSHTEIRILPAESIDAAEGLLADQPLTVILLDLAQDCEQGLHWLAKVRKEHPQVPVIAMSDSSESRLAIEAVKGGALDFLGKPLVDSEIVRAVDEAIRVSERAREPVEIDPRNERDDDHDTLVGNSRAMLDVYKALGRLSATPVTVLVRGETGTGKELVARALFQHGHRSHRPFITVNCAAIPENLLESELFGHERGAFTGAVSRRIGKFEQANGATLFLDEIGDLDLALQAKLLRVLQEKRFQRVGGSEELPVDVRIIAATHRNLERMITEGNFREDLFYRLNVATIRLPPLRDRTGDIPLLARFFLRRFSTELGLPAAPIHRDAISRLESARLPGNIRQLQNIIRKAILRSRGYAIDGAMIDDLLLETEPPDPARDPAGSIYEFCENLVREAEQERATDIHQEAVETVEAQLLEIALRHNGGNISRTSQWLGLSRLTVREKGRKYGLLS